MVGATSVIQHVRRGGRGAPWIIDLLKRKPPKLAAVALANKVARVAWKLMVSGQCYSAKSAPTALARAAKRSARHGEQFNCNRAEPMPGTCKETSRWCDRTRVAETILASVQVRARQQAGHMDASDLIRALPEHPCEKGAVHIWIKEGKSAVKWTRLSCRTFGANPARLQLHALACNLGNFMRTLALPRAAERWSLTSLRQKLIKIGAKAVSHGRYVTSRWPRSRCRGRCSRKCHR